jgi:hypothetical protein
VTVTWKPADVLYYDVSARVGEQKRQSLNKHCGVKECRIPVDVFMAMGMKANDPIDIAIAGVNSYGIGNFSEGALLFAWWEDK